jgi:hypothetical protein
MGRAGPLAIATAICLLQVRPPALATAAPLLLLWLAAAAARIGG